MWNGTERTSLISPFCAYFRRTPIIQLWIPSTSIMTKKAQQKTPDGIFFFAFCSFTERISILTNYYALVNLLAMYKVYGRHKIRQDISLFCIPSSNQGRIRAEVSYFVYRYLFTHFFFKWLFTNVNRECIVTYAICI